MSQASDLLNSLTDDQITLYSSNSETEGHIIIGNDRYITIPEELKRIAVQFDHNVETVTFDCPRYWDDLDMSEMIIYINYMLPNGQQGAYIAENIEADGDIMHFTWTITNNITENKGNISFLVCIKKTNADGDEINHWNSELNRDMYISEGLECAETILSEYPDIVTQLLTRMTNVEDIAVTAAEIEALLAETKTAASQAETSKELAESAKDDVELRLSTLGDDYANSIKGNIKGEIIKVDDISPVEHTVKAKVRGKNKFNALKIHTTGPLTDYAYISSVSEGTVVVYSNATDNGYCSSGITLRKVCGDLIVGNSYTLSAITSSASRTYIYLTGAEIRWNLNTSLVMTEVILDSTLVFYGLADGEGDGECAITNIQIEEGDTATEYEPYVDPSTVTVTGCGKNLFDIDNVTNFFNSDGQIQATSISTIIDGEIVNNLGSYGSLIMCNPGISILTAGTYSLSFDAKSFRTEGDKSIRVVFQFEDGTYITMIANTLSDYGVWEHFTKTITLDEDKKVMGFGFQGGGVAGDYQTLQIHFKNIQIELDDTATDFETYTGATYTPATDGTVSIKSVSPTMTIFTDTPGVTVEAEYNKDLSKTMGDLESAMDAIISMQETLIGGEAL